MTANKNDSLPLSGEKKPSYGGLIAKNAVEKTNKDAVNSTAGRKFSRLKIHDKTTGSNTA